MSADSHELQELGDDCTAPTDQHANGPTPGQPCIGTGARRRGGPTMALCNKCEQPFMLDANADASLPKWHRCGKCRPPKEDQKGAGCSGGSRGAPCQPNGRFPTGQEVSNATAPMEAPLTTMSDSADECKGAAGAYNSMGGKAPDIGHAETADGEECMNLVTPHRPISPTDASAHGGSKEAACIDLVSPSPRSSLPHAAGSDSEAETGSEGEESRECYFCGCHVTCDSLTRVPRGSWFCFDCRGADHSQPKPEQQTGEVGGRGTAVYTVATATRQPLDQDQLLVGEVGGRGTAVVTVTTSVASAAVDTGLAGGVDRKSKQPMLSSLAVAPEAITGLGGVFASGAALELGNGEVDRKGKQPMLSSLAAAPEAITGLGGVFTSGAAHELGNGGHTISAIGPPLATNSSASATASASAGSAAANAIAGGASTAAAAPPAEPAELPPMTPERLEALVKETAAAIDRPGLVKDKVAAMKRLGTGRGTKNFLLEGEVVELLQEAVKGTGIKIVVAKSEKAPFDVGACREDEHPGFDDLVTACLALLQIKVTTAWRGNTFTQARFWAHSKDIAFNQYKLPGGYLLLVITERDGGIWIISVEALERLARKSTNKMMANERLTFFRAELAMLLESGDPECFFMGFDMQRLMAILLHIILRGPLYS
ncbi:hypothetical protein WJX72_007998 [[Myrmecia] bisecta]|uniref:Uncharacterized protein n=1 Tax=[Myrmecia] bisecta TaxID=41462 RepID=A0AAW1QRN8_9CHLO